MDEIEKKSCKFLADAMLGKIARKLRFLGFDTFYQSNIEDIEVIDISIKEKRIILTGDRNLFARTVRLNLDSLLLDKITEMENLVKILSSLGIKHITLSPFSTRCTICNNQLTMSSDKNEIKSKNIVPPYILNTIDIFFLCSKCNKVYWDGSHIKYMDSYIGKINTELSKMIKYK